MNTRIQRLPNVVEALLQQQRRSLFLGLRIGGQGKRGVVCGGNRGDQRGHPAPQRLPLRTMLLDRRLHRRVPLLRCRRRAVAAPASAVVRDHQVLEQQLAGIWQEVLKVERVGLGDNFFDLGGHSLQVVVMLSRVRAVLGVDVAVKDFYAQDSLGALAQSLVDATRDDGLDDDFDLIFDALDELEQENLEETNA